MSALVPRHRLRHEHGIVNSLLGRIGSRLKQPVHGVIIRHAYHALRRREVVKPRLGLHGHITNGDLVRGRKGKKDVSGIIVSIATDLAETNSGTSSKPLQLDRDERRVRRHDNNDAAVLAWLRLVGRLGSQLALSLQDAADGHAADAKRLGEAVVGLDEDADGVVDAVAVGAVALDDAAAGPRAALEAVAYHARAAAGVALGHGVGGGALNPLHDVLGRHGEPRRVAQEAVVRLGNDGQQKQVYLAALSAVVAVDILGDAAVALADRGRGRDDDGGAEQAGLVEPVRARHLAAAVEAEDAGKARVLVPVWPRQDGGDARVNMVIRLNRLRMHQDAGDVGDGVEASGWPSSQVDVWEDVANPVAPALVCASHGEVEYVCRTGKSARSRMRWVLIGR